MKPFLAVTEPGGTSSNLSEREDAGSRESPAPTILVIDDDQIVCAVTERVLGAFGFRVLTATDSGEGITLFRRHSREIACTLLDVTMPGPGVEVTLDEIRRDHPQARVILVSGHNAAELASRFPPGKVSAVLQKPFDPERLRALLDEVLSS
jgi:DNA-binding NtrC family response regulator